MLRALLILLLAAAVVAGGAYFVAGRGAPPDIVIEKPARVVGQDGTLEVVTGVPSGRLTTLDVSIEQDGKTTPLFTLDGPEAGSLVQVDENHVRLTRPFGRKSVPELRSGPARIVVSASRPSFLDLRTLSNSASKDFEVDLDPPSVAVASTHHYINHGGSEMVVYRTPPPDSVSGVRVGDLEYRGYPAAVAGVASSDAELHVAFFSLQHDQDLTAPLALFARDEAGNQSTAAFADDVFPKPFRKSRIELDDRFLQRVVPEILAHSPELQIDSPENGDYLTPFLKINGELRRSNAERIIAITANTSSSRLWEGPFLQLGNSQVEAGFADHRTYLYRGEEVDQQVHLGFDLAVTARVPVLAANAGKVLFAEWLGIYGNCVIVDHGMGVASLYAHLSSIAVKVGDTVARGQALGRSGMTGLAGGDHLHFSMLVSGRPVNPVEWWDPHWIQDRVDRKLNESARP